MSWNSGVQEASTEELPDAIAASETDVQESDLPADEAKQLKLARKLANDIVKSGLLPGEHFEVVLCGHHDEGDHTTQPSFLQVRINEVREVTEIPDAE